MDDMVFQNNNKNAIYVLNTSYNTYGEIGRPHGCEYPQFSSDEIYSYPKSSLSRSLHKLKCFRHHSSEMISGSCSDTADRYSSSVAATYCSPAATALQKLFNCSNTPHGCKSINLKNKNCHSNSHIAHDLNHHGSRKDNQHHHRHTHPETGKQQYWEHPQLEYRHLEHHTPLSLRSNTNCGNKSTSSTSCVLPSVVSNSRAGTGKKKHSNSTVSVKSTLIAKKTKFWKYLVEEEKWRKHSAENLSTTNCERDFGRSLSSSTFDDGNSQVTIDGCSGIERSVRTKCGSISNHSSKSNSSSCSGNDFRISNWSGSIDTIKSSNNNSHQKSSAELYKEAAQLLGLSCTLCDNCRCLDCQSRYFECDDSDSYSEFSLVDEFYETLQDVDRSIKQLHTRNFSSPSLQHSQEDEISLSEDQQTSTDLETNVLDHCESFNDLSLENSPESGD